MNFIHFWPCFLWIVFGFQTIVQCFQCFLSKHEIDSRIILSNSNLRRSLSAASAPGIVIVRLDVEPTLYFFSKGLHNLIFTKISNIVLAKTLTTGEMGGGKKLQFNRTSIHTNSLLLHLTSLEKTMGTYFLWYHFDAFEKISNMSN